MNPSGKRAHVDGLLARLCAAMKIAPVRLDTEGGAALQGRLEGHTATITVVLHEEDDVLMLQGPVGPPPPGEAGQSLLLSLLGLNLAVDQTAGTAFAWDPGGDTVLLTHALVGPAIAYEAFHAAFFRLFGVIVAWQDRMEKIRAAAPMPLTAAES